MELAAYPHLVTRGSRRARAINMAANARQYYFYEFRLFIESGGNCVFKKKLVKNHTNGHIFLAVFCHSEMMKCQNVGYILFI